MLRNQLKTIGEEGLSSIQDVRNMVAEVGIKIRETQEQLDVLQKNFVKKYDEIVKLKTALQELKKKEGVYKNLVEICSDEDYISRLVRLAREQMTEQESAKLQALQQEKYIVYCPQTVEQLPYKKLSKRPNIDEYFQVIEGNWIDIDGNDLAEKLEEVYQQNSISIGSVIAVKEQEQTRYFYVNDVGFVRFDDFEKSCLEQQRQKEQQQIAAKKRGR